MRLLKCCLDVVILLMLHGSLLGDVTPLSLDIQRTVAQKVYNSLYDENSKESFACLQDLLLHTSLVQDIKVNETLLSRALLHNICVDAIRVLVDKGCRIDEKSLDYLHLCLEKKWFDVCAHLINKKFSRRNKKNNPVKFTVELVLKKGAMITYTVLNVISPSTKLKTLF